MWPQIHSEPNEAGYSQEIRDQVVRMYVDELNFRRIARTRQVNHQAVINWVNAHRGGLPDTLPLSADRPGMVELE